MGNINGVPQTLEKLFVNNEHDYRYCGIFNCDPRWVNTLAEIVTWDKSVFGDRMNYSFFEYDGTGSTTETTVSFPVKIGNTTLTVSNKLSIKSQDFPIGQSEIEYCDNSQGEGYTYSAGSFEFQVRQK